MSSKQADDGVDRDSFAFQAGWLEGLRALAQVLHQEGMRAGKQEIPGLALTRQVVKRCFDLALATLKEGNARRRGEAAAKGGQEDQR